MLWGTYPAAASLAPEMGAGTEIVAPNGAPNQETLVECRALQCGLLGERSASQAVAIAAGAKPAATSYSPAMFPEIHMGSSSARALGGPRFMNGGNVGSGAASAGVEPALFGIIGPAASVPGQLCIDDGNLLGLKPTCKGEVKPPPRLGDICIDDGNLLGLKSSCRVAVVPEPATPLLLALGMLALLMARARRKLLPRRSA